MKIIGRDSEIALIQSLLKAGKHVLLEGPVGSGKTSLALKVAGEEVIRIDGDGRFTEQKLVGSFDPKLVMELGFCEKSFIAGPLTLAMLEGRTLLINELNRMPEMVQNVLLPALDSQMGAQIDESGETQSAIQIPNLGTVKAEAGFRLIATQNPREFVGTSSLSEALLDRMEWVSIAYLSEAQECEILKSLHISDELIEKIVLLVRLTRNHAKIKRGASIRAAISMAEVLSSMGGVDAKPSTHQTVSDELFWQVATSVLANRIELQVSKFSAQAYSQSLNEALAELKVSLDEALKKKRKK